MAMTSRITVDVFKQMTTGSITTIHQTPLSGSTGSPDTVNVGLLVGLIIVGILVLVGLMLRLLVHHRLRKRKKGSPKDEEQAMPFYGQISGRENKSSYLEEEATEKDQLLQSPDAEAGPSTKRIREVLRGNEISNEAEQAIGYQNCRFINKGTKSNVQVGTGNLIDIGKKHITQTTIHEDRTSGSEDIYSLESMESSNVSSSTVGKYPENQLIPPRSGHNMPQQCTFAVNADVCAESESEAVDIWRTKELSTVTDVPNLLKKHGVLKEKEELPEWKELDELDTLVTGTSLSVMEMTEIPNEPKTKGRDYCEKEIPTVEKQEFMSRTDQIFPTDGGKDETKQRTCPELMSTNKIQCCEAEEYSIDIPFKELHPVKSGTNITQVRILNATVSHETRNGVTSLIKAQRLVENFSSLSVNIVETFHGGKDGHGLIENQTEMQEFTCPDKYGRIQNMQEFLCSSDRLDMVIEDEGRDKSAERDTLYKEKRKETSNDNKDSDEITPELQLLQSENGTGMILQDRKDSNKFSDYPISQTWNLRDLSDIDLDIDSNPECQNLETTNENKQIFIKKDASDGLAKHLSLEKLSKGKCSTIKEIEDQITTEKQMLERDGRQAFVSCNEEHIYISVDKPREIRNGALTDIDDADISPEKCESGKSLLSHADDSILVIHSSPPAMEPKSESKDLLETTFLTVEEKQQSRSGTEQIFPMDGGKDETKRTYPKTTFTNKTQFDHAEKYSVEIPFKEVNLVTRDTDMTQVRTLYENAGHETGNGVTPLIKEMDNILLFTEAPSVQHTVSDESVTACVSDEQNNSSQDRIREQGEIDCTKSAKPSYTRIRKQYHPKMIRTICYRNIKFFKGKVEKKNPTKIFKGPLPLGNDTRKMTIPNKRRDSKREKRITVVDVSRMVIPQGEKTNQVDITPHQNENNLDNSFDYRVDEQKMSEVQKSQSFTKESNTESALVATNGSNRSEDKNRIDRSDNHKDAQNLVENLSGLSAGREETFDGWKDGHELIKNQTEMQELTCPDKYGRFQNMQESLCSSDRLDMVIEDEGRVTSAGRNILYREKRKETPPDAKDSDEITPELQLLQSENGTGTILQNMKDGNKFSDHPISQTWNLRDLSGIDLDVDSNPECQNLETTSENKPLFINEDKSDGLGKQLSLERDSKGQHPSNKEREDQVTTEKQILETEGRLATLSCSEEHIDISADKPVEIKNETLTDIDEANIKPSIHQYVSTCAYISSENYESGKSRRVSDEDDASSDSGSSSFMDAVKYAIKNGDDTYVRQYLETQAWEHEDEIPLYLEYSLAFQDSDGIPTMTMVFLSWICMELTKRHKPYTVAVWPATLPGPGEDRFQELPVLVCNYWDDVKEIYSGRSFFGLTVKYQEYNTVNDEDLCVQNSKEFLENKLSISDAILANEIVSQNADWLMNSHSNLEIIKPCHIRIIRSEVFYETCIVLYCRSKGYIPFRENLFPMTLTFQDKSLPVDVREGFFVPAMMQENSSFTNAGGNMDANAAGDEEAWDHNLFRMGISMGPYDKPISATVGPFVRIGENDVGFLTCAHAFGIPSNVDSVVTKAVVSPAKEESPPTDDFIPIHNIDPTCGYIDKIRFDNDPKPNVNVDAALIRLISNKQPRKGRFPWMKHSDLEQAGLTRGQILKFDDGKIVKKTTIEQGELTSGKFIKVGAASGVTSSNYLGHEQAVIKFRQVANLSHEHGSLYPPIIGGTRYYIMKGQYIIYSNFRKNFIILGDSGSGVFHMDDQRKLRCIGIGIGFMNYGREAVVTPIEDVLEALELPEDALMKFSLAPTAGTMEDEDHESN